MSWLLAGALLITSWTYDDAVKLQRDINLQNMRDQGLECIDGRKCVTFPADVWWGCWRADSTCAVG